MLTESKVKEVLLVTSAHSDLGARTINVTGNFDGYTDEQIAQLLTEKVREYGYRISVGKEEVKKSTSEFRIAIPITIIFVALFIFLQKAGLVNLISGDDVGYGTAFVIGIVASLSTCMAVVGGLVLSMSATFAKSGEQTKPQILFHLGRLVSFFVLGGMLGLLGGVINIGVTTNAILSAVVAIVMLILGVNLLDVFHFAKKLQPTIPKAISKHALQISKLNHTLTPFLVGIATFILPCGFTQSMQVYTLTTGSFITGAFTMFSFALGTLPVLLVLSFSSLNISTSPKRGIFFKSAGLIVVAFAIMNIINSLVVAGLIQPVFTF